MICDDPGVQRVLPQVIIANEATVTQAQYAPLRSTCPPNVRLLRRKSAWVDIPLFAQIITWLAAALAPFLEEFQLFVFFDANHYICTARFSGHVRGADCGLSSLLLQPRGSCSRWIRMRSCFTNVACARRTSGGGIQSASGAVTVGMLLAAIYTAIKDVLETRDWASSFERDGFGAAQVGVSARVVEHVGGAVPLAVPSTRPTLEQLRQCWPRRARVPVADVWRRTPPPVVAAPADRRSARIAAAAGLSAPAPSAVAVAVCYPLGPTKRPASCARRPPM